MERGAGHYFVVIKTRSIMRRTVAFYFDDEDYWVILGTSDMLNDSDFEYIGDKIEMPLIDMPHD